MSFQDDAAKIFQFDEGDGLPGRPGIPYRDSNGYWTIGRGHLIGENIFELKLSPAMIEALFREDLTAAYNEALSIVGCTFFYEMTRPRQMALVSMLYTLGRVKFLKFNETIEAIKAKQWETVSQHILASKWARDVDPKMRPGEGRDDRIAYMFLTGNYHPDYNL